MAQLVGSLLHRHGGPEFGPTKVGEVACDCHPSIEEAEIDRFLGLANQPSANQPLVSPRTQ